MPNEMFTQLPTVASAQMTDIICAVQGYVSSTVPGLSVQETLGQVFNLFQSNIILFYAGAPNGFVAGTTFQLLWDTTDKILWICTTTGNAASAVWTRADINNGYATTVTSGGTTVLTIASPYWQYFTGSAAQTLVMAVESTLAAGVTWGIVNNSTGAITITSSGGNTIVTLAASQVATITCILTTGTTAASWNSIVVTEGAGVLSITGTTNEVIASASTGAVTLSLPQPIATTSAVEFASVQFSGNNGLLDSNAKELLTVTPAGSSSVNNVNIANAATGASPTLSAVGTDTNIILELKGKGNGGVLEQGITSGSTIPAGFKGEAISNSGSGTFTTSNTPYNIITLSLTPGLWLVNFVSLISASSYNTTAYQGGITLVSATLPTLGNVGTFVLNANGQTSTTFGLGGVQASGLTTVNIAANTSVYLVAQATWSGGTAPNWSATIEGIRI